MKKVEVNKSFFSDNGNLVFVKNSKNQLSIEVFDKNKKVLKTFLAILS
jgi:hypothetical protein